MSHCGRMEVNMFNYKAKRNFRKLLNNIEVPEIEKYKKAHHTKPFKSNFVKVATVVTCAFLIITILSISLFNDKLTTPPVVEHPSTPSGTFSTDNTAIPTPDLTYEALSTESIPFDNNNFLKIKYCVFTGHEADDGYTGTTASYSEPQILETAAELAAFASQNGINESPDVDFSKESIIAVYGYDYGFVEYLSPLVGNIGQNYTLYVYKRTRTTNNGDHTYRIAGYFLTVDRTVLDLIVPVESGDTIIYGELDATSELDDITPERLSENSDIRIYGNHPNGHDYKCYIVQPGYAARPLGMFGVTAGTGEIMVSDDLSYIVYSYGWGSGMYRSHFVIEFLDGTGRSYQSHSYMNSSMKLEHLSNDKWAIYSHNSHNFAAKSEGAIACFTVNSDGLQFEVIDESARELLPSYVRERQERADAVTIKTTFPDIKYKKGKQIY